MVPRQNLKELTVYPYAYMYIREYIDRGRGGG